MLTRSLAARREPGVLLIGDPSAWVVSPGEAGNDAMSGQDSVTRITFEAAETLDNESAETGDSIFGTDGADMIIIDRGKVFFVDAGAGDDLVSFRDRGQTLVGGDGFDTLVVRFHEGHRSLIFDASGSTGFGSIRTVFSGFERYEVTGMVGADTVTLGPNGDVYFGSVGDDTVHGGAGDDLLHGELWSDVIYGEDGNDTLLGGSSSDILSGGGGNDRLIGGDWSDTLFGEDGMDTLFGGNPTGSGWTVFGGDLLSGGTGADTFRLNPQTDRPNTDIISDFVTGEDQIVFPHSRLEASSVAGRIAASDLSYGTVRGTQGQFLYVVEGSDGRLYWDTDGAGEGGATLLVTLTGAPTLVAADIVVRGGRLADALLGDDDDDRLDGGGQNDTLNGGAGNDKLFGGNHNDNLSGGTGNDTLFGGCGDDVMLGDAGADTFRFTTMPETGGAGDRIGDFETGIDHLVFLQSLLERAVDTGRMTESDLSFGTLIGRKGQFLYVVAGSEGQLFWDGDGRGADPATLLVTLTGAPALEGTDIWIV